MIPRSRRSQSRFPIGSSCSRPSTPGRRKSMSRIFKLTAPRLWTLIAALAVLSEIPSLHQKLNQGDALVIVERKGDWTKVVKAGVTMWVATRYISEKFVSPPASTQPNTFMSASKPEPRVSRKSSGGMCPCSARQVCIGPRGGRYCMTSNGRKRYGI